MLRRRLCCAVRPISLLRLLKAKRASNQHGCHHFVETPQQATRIQHQQSLVAGSRFLSVDAAQRSVLPQLCPNSERTARCILDSIGIFDRDELDEVAVIEKLLDFMYQDDGKGSLEFLQILADNGLLDSTSTISLGTSVHQDLARFFVYRTLGLVRGVTGFNDGRSQFMEGPTGCGKSTMIRAMTSVLPALAPSLRALYLDANFIGSTGNSANTRSLGNFVWDQLKGDEKLMISADQQREFNDRVEKGGCLYLLEDIMPVVQHSGLRLLLAIDEIEKYFLCEDPLVDWSRDLALLGNFVGFPLVGILSGSSAHLADLLEAPKYLRGDFPKATQRLNTTKITKHRHPVANPFSLRVAREALKHPTCQIAEPDSVLMQALIMIGAGSNIRHMMDLATAPSINLLSSVATPHLPSKANRVIYPPGHDSLAIAANHVYHEMFKLNLDFWHESGVKKALGRSPTCPVQAIEALAKYIAERTPSDEGSLVLLSDEDLLKCWSENAVLWVPKTELISAYREIHQFGAGVALGYNDRSGIDLLIQYRFLVSDGAPYGEPTEKVAAPSLSHVLGAVEPVSELVIDEKFRAHMLPGETLAKVRERILKEESAQREKQQYYVIAYRAIIAVVAAILGIPVVSAAIQQVEIAVIHGHPVRVQTTEKNSSQRERVKT